MNVKISARAGSQEANDIYILVEPQTAGGIEIDLESPVIRQFGRSIEHSIRETAEQMQISNIKITARDGGALDFTIRARVETAIKRALER